MLTGFAAPGMEWSKVGPKGKHKEDSSHDVDVNTVEVTSLAGRFRQFLALREETAMRELALSTINFCVSCEEKTQRTRGGRRAAPAAKFTL